MAERKASNKPAAAAAEAVAVPSLLDQIVLEGRIGRDESAKEWGR